MILSSESDNQSWLQMLICYFLSFFFVYEDENVMTAHLFSSFNSCTCPIPVSKLSMTQPLKPNIHSCFFHLNKQIDFSINYHKAN